MNPAPSLALDRNAFGFVTAKSFCPPLPLPGNVYQQGLKRRGKGPVLTFGEGAIAPDQHLIKTMVD